MPKFDTFEDLQKLYLPSTKDLPNEEDRAWVVMDVSPSKVGDLSGVNRPLLQGEISIAIISARIKEWNYTDQNGELLPINEETVSLIKMTDFHFLQEQIKDEEVLSDEQKKTLSATSQPSETASSQT